MRRFSGQVCASADFAVRHFISVDLRKLRELKLIVKNGYPDLG